MNKLRFYVLVGLIIGIWMTLFPPFLLEPNDLLVNVIVSMISWPLIFIFWVLLLGQFLMVALIGVLSAIFILTIFGFLIIAADFNRKPRKERLSIRREIYRYSRLLNAKKKTVYEFKESLKEI